MSARIERIIEAADRALLRTERAAIRELQAHLAVSYQNLIEQLRVPYREALAATAGQARQLTEGQARQLLAQVEAAMRALDLGSAESGVPSHLRQALLASHGQGVQNAGQLLALHQSAQFGFMELPLEAAEMQVANSAARLSRHSQEAITRINQAVVDGLVRGQGIRALTEVIQGRVGVLAHRAETIARTEIVSANNDARNAYYEREGIEWVQIFATLDDRTCPYCAARHGLVYERDRDILPPYHPNCRCYAAPAKREWIEQGMVDADWWRSSQREMRAQLAAVGRQPTNQLTPFERLRDKPRPRAVWTPASGFV